MTEALPNRVPAGRAAYALFCHRELASGLGVLPWIDMTAEGLEDAMMPELDEVVSSTLSFLRNSTKVAPATIAAMMEKRMNALVEGNSNSASKSEDRPGKRKREEENKLEERLTKLRADVTKHAPLKAYFALDQHHPHLDPPARGWCLPLCP